MEQAKITIFGADSSYYARVHSAMLTHDQLLTALAKLKEDGRTTNADLARLLRLPTSRIAEIFKGARKITVDEAYLIADRFNLEGETPRLTADQLQPLLDALLPMLPDGDPSAQSVKALSEALSYGLGLLEDSRASHLSQDALRVAARAAATRFRESALQ